MIVLTMASAIAIMGLQASVNVPRSAFKTCIAQAHDKAKAENVKPEGYAEYVRTACGPAGAKLKSALVAFDTKNGIGRSQANADAQMEIDEAFDRAQMQYKRLNGTVAEAQQ